MVPRAWWVGIYTWWAWCESWRFRCPLTAVIPPFLHCTWVYSIAMRALPTHGLLELVVSLGGGIGVLLCLFLCACLSSCRVFAISKEPQALDIRGRAQ
jgi:hypothetical protein